MKALCLAILSSISWGCARFVLWSTPPPFSVPSLSSHPFVLLASIYLLSLHSSALSFTLLRCAPISLGPQGTAVPVRRTLYKDISTHMHTFQHWLFFTPSKLMHAFLVSQTWVYIHLWDTSLLKDPVDVILEWLRWLVWSGKDNSENWQFGCSEELLRDILWFI